MDTPPALFDTRALARIRARARRDFSDFLHQLVADDLQDRLDLVNRSFTKLAVVSGFPDFWRDRLPLADHVMESERIDLPDQDYDAILHVLSLHWSDDPVGQLIQCRRALRPDGLLLVATFGGQTLQELRRALAQAETEITGGLSPRVAPMGEIRDLGGLLQRAGLALPVADCLDLAVSYATPRDLMHDLRRMGETNAMAARLRHPTRPELMRRADALYREAFGDKDGRVTATFEVIVLTGWAPDTSQPQPLRPGSAAARLADALKTDETPLAE